MGAPKELVHRKLALWQQHGVLREEAAGRYSVLETGSSREKVDRGVMLIDSDEERDSNTTTQSEQREEKLQVSTPSRFLPSLQNVQELELMGRLKCFLNMLKSVLMILGNLKLLQCL